MTENNNEKELISYKYYPKYFNPILILVLITLLIRLLLVNSDGYGTDLNTFKAWANMLYKNNLSNFYYDPSFTDYPPLYMYFLYVIGFIINILKIPFDSTMAIILIKLPAIFFDVLTVVFIYKVAIKKMLPKTAFFLGLIYALNPAIFVDSAIWGQIDSFYTFLMAVSVYFLVKSPDSHDNDKTLINKNYLFSFLLFTLAVLAKPQALIFSPIYIFVFFRYLFTNYSKKQKIYSILVTFISCIALIFIVCIPFINGLDFRVITKQYVSTLSQYDYTTLNAYNFYNIIGKNFVDANQIFFATVTYKAFGTFSIIFFTIVTFCFLYENRFNKFSLFFSCAFINTSTFLFSTKMHERYLFPTLLFLLLTYIYKKDKKLLILFFLFSFTLFVNCTDVLKLALYDYDYSLLSYGSMVIPYINLAGFVLMSYMLLKWLDGKALDDDTLNTDTDFSYEIYAPVEPNAPKKIRKKDIIYILIVTIIYSVIGLHNLGDNNNPQTFTKFNANDAIQITFDDITEVEFINVLPGVKPDKAITLSTYNENVESYVYIDVPLESVFRWYTQEIDVKTSAITITFPDDDTYIHEIAFLDKDVNLIPFEITYISDNLDMESAKRVFDEQDLYEPKSTYMNSTYFDEVYHPRTAFEFVHKIDPYETTHPPLGKDIMAFSVKHLGMTPFAYRLPGVIAGILMIPLIYIFALKMFKSSEFALFSSILLSFEFMHFTQTRLATIDSFVTLFILLMFFFMYLYYDSNFYYTDNKKMLKYLSLCGISMGLACSTKWTGVYAGVGVGIIFFMTLFSRFNEYTFENKTNNFTVTKDFKKKTTNTILWCILFFIIIPITIYVLSYIPFLQAVGNMSFSEIIKNQQYMLSYHKDLVSTHPYASDYWTWPLMIRPVYYYSNIATYDGIIAGISAFGNPFVFYAGTFSIFYTFTRLKTENRKIALFLLVAYFSSMVPWILVSRTSYMYHYFPASVISILMIANMFKETFKTIKNKYVIIYLLLVILAFIIFYPVISGMPVSSAYINMLRLFKTWTLGPV